MREIVSIRSLDNNGRIVIPREVRDKLEIGIGCEVEIYMEESSIKIRKFNPICTYCGSVNDIIVYRGIYVCRNCKIQLRSK